MRNHQPAFLHAKKKAACLITKDKRRKRLFRPDLSLRRRSARYLLTAVFPTFIPARTHDKGAPHAFARRFVTVTIEIALKHSSHRCCSFPKDSESLTSVSHHTIKTVTCQYTCNIKMISAQTLVDASRRRKGGACSLLFLRTDVKHA